MKLNENLILTETKNVTLLFTIKIFSTKLPTRNRPRKTRRFETALGRRIDGWFPISPTTLPDGALNALFLGLLDERKGLRRVRKAINLATLPKTRVLLKLALLVHPRTLR